MDICSLHIILHKLWFRQVRHRQYKQYCNLNNFVWILNQNKSIFYFILTLCYSLCLLYTNLIITIFLFPPSHIFYHTDIVTQPDIPYFLEIALIGNQNKLTEWPYDTACILDGAPTFYYGVDASSLWLFCLRMDECILYYLHFID